METIFGILGFAGGVFCASADMLLDLKGADNKKLGKHEFIDSNWKRMPIWRFRLSILLVMFGVPLYFLGLTAMAQKLTLHNETFGMIFWISGMVGSIGGFFIHVILCLMPVIYKTMSQRAGFELTEKVINEIYYSIKIPFFIMYILLVVVSSIMIWLAFFLGWLSFSPVLLIFTPMTLLIIGVTLRKIKINWFFDLPGIVMPSIGLGMIGIMAVLG